MLLYVLQYVRSPKRGGARRTLVIILFLTASYCIPAPTRIQGSFSPRRFIFASDQLVDGVRAACASLSVFSLGGVGAVGLRLGRLGYICI